MPRRVREPACEGQTTEFKATLRTHVKNRGMRIQDIKYQSIIVINSFLNTEEDEKFLEEEKRKIFQQLLIDQFFTVNGKDICLIDIEHSDSPAFIEKDGNQLFFVRRGNKTVQLEPKEQNPYISKHF